MKDVRLGVVGIGVMGEVHLRNLEAANRVRLTAVCDVIRDRADRAAARYKCASYYDHRALIGDKVCDALLIVTPHYAHTTVGIDALNAGLHVLVEKPISVHKADAERLLAAHNNKHQIFAAMFNQRTDPRYREIRSMLERGDLGKLDRITWIITDWFRTDAYYADGGWRATWAGEGGGVLMNQCPHNLDLWQWMFGMPDRVRAFCKLGRKHTIEVEDEVTACMEYRDGCSGVLVTSTGEAPGTNRLEIAGEFGRIVAEEGELRFTRNEVSANEVIRRSSDKYARPPVSKIHVPASGQGGQHVEVLQNFIDAIVSGVPLIAPAPEGIRSVELSNAMLYSSETGKTVELPLNAGAYERMLKRLIRKSAARPRGGLSSR
jgi:predicted dehydrogenase